MKRKRENSSNDIQNDMEECKLHDEVFENSKIENEDKTQTQDDGKNPPNIDNACNYLTLGENMKQVKSTVNMVLSNWLSHPTIISNDINANFIAIDNINYISPKIKETLSEMNIKNLFPVQNEVIPWILNACSKPPAFRPRDICVSAPTGSGKTLTFAIPIVQLLSERVKCEIRALVVLPTNELALQVYKVFKSLTFKTILSVCLLSKSNTLEAEQQKLIDYFNKEYHSKVDIVISTPGRLVEHLNSTKGFCLKNLKFLVIDEADKIIGQIHHDWLYHLENHIKNTLDINSFEKLPHFCLYNLENYVYYQPQKLLFSATLSQDPEKIQNLGLFQPKLFTSVSKNLVETSNLNNDNNTSVTNDFNSNNNLRGTFVGKYATPAELTEKYCITESNIKPLTLFTLIKENSWKKFLCFTNSVESAHRLTFILQSLFRKNTTIAEISSNLKPKQRIKVINNFSLGKITGLVCSDALTRGIDIPDVDIVISYDMPRHINTYIHRIGRTARAGRPGAAIIILNERELVIFKKTLADAGKELGNEIKIESNIETDFLKVYSRVLNKFKSKLEREKKVEKLHKDIIARKAIPVSEKIIKEMSLMEKLQVQADKIVGDQLQKKFEKNKLKHGKRK